MSARSGLSWLAWCFASTILISAFLVFQVQPIISKFILPWFGGTPAVWTTCMLFFQVLLFAGYAYAHTLTRLLTPRWQGAVHLGLIFLSLLLLPITPTEAWKPASGSQPTWHILMLLGSNVGLPYFLLASTGPLIQAWFSSWFPGRSPYRLYALSNVGSLAALLTYPFLFEPALGGHSQAAFWSLGFCLFGLMCGLIALTIRRTRRSPAAGEPRQPSPVGGDLPMQKNPQWSDYLCWLALPAFASLTLLATTNHVCQDVAVIPFLWVAPLSLYLITFIICFDNESWYSRRWCGWAALCACAAVCVLSHLGKTRFLVTEIAAYFSVMFFVCMLCHGELVRRKPNPLHLTSFYLMCSAGGALGGILVAIVCPLLFTSCLEMNLAVVVGYIGAVAAILADGKKSWFERRLPWKHGAALVGCLGFLIVLRVQAAPLRERPLDATRNFYGTLRVIEGYQETPHRTQRFMYHGRISHGAQFLDPKKRLDPTTYFAPQSGVGITLQRFPRSRPLRVGVVGLGVGTLAAYGRPGDYYRIYEINEAVVDLANRYFTFLAESQAQIDIVLGDGRLSLEREAPQRFDVLVLDAFSGDAVPAHLLTKEAMTLYLRHLEPDGVVAFHITNTHVNLEPVVQRLAEFADLPLRYVCCSADVDAGRDVSHWALVTRNERLLHDGVFQAAAKQKERDYDQVPLWTDQYNNLFQVLR